MADTTRLGIPRDKDGDLFAMARPFDHSIIQLNKLGRDVVVDVRTAVLPLSDGEGYISRDLPRSVLPPDKDTRTSHPHCHGQKIKKCVE